MNYPEATDWLFRQLPMYQRQGAAAYKADLTGTYRVLEMLGRPDQQLHNVIHVAGTNGKGSVCTAIARALEQQGMKVGLFTSPHLLDFRERMRVNGVVPSEAWVAAFVDRHRPASEALDPAPSFFEWTFGMALCYFMDEGVEAVVLETGMGGRLDSTNVFPTPLLTVITNVGLDHQQFLGHDIRSIAREKAGILKEGVPVVMGRMRPEAQSVILETANRLGVETHYAEPSRLGQLAEDGPHWPENRATAHKALEVLGGLPFGRGWTVPGLAELNKSGHLGRWQWVSADFCRGRILLECAHNADGLMTTLSALDELCISHAQRNVVIGAVADKDLQSVLTAFDQDSRYYFCAANIPRAMPAEELALQAKQFGLNGTSYPSVEAAFRAACEEASPSSLVLVLGSIFVAAEVLAVLEDARS